MFLRGKEVSKDWNLKSVYSVRNITGIRPCTSLAFGSYFWRVTEVRKKICTETNPRIFSADCFKINKNSGLIISIILRQ
jgi:hypothetical protein